jgi:hypothetical protein
LAIRNHQQRNVADLAGPAALHDNAVEVKIRMLALDPPVPSGLDDCSWRANYNSTPTTLRNISPIRRPDGT